jgi:hypothetical protein
MRSNSLRTHVALGAGLALLLAALPALAGTPIDRVPAGFDYWQTLGSGATAYSFANDPLPAGFFCAGSKAFTGILQFEGVPLASEPAGILGTTDTIIERLTDAVFDDEGVATTQIRARALSLAAKGGIRTSCGLWRATAKLADDQPVTSMRFTRTWSNGGVFDADLWLKVRLTFTRISDQAKREATRVIHMPTTTATPYTCWARTTTVSTGAQSVSLDSSNEASTSASSDTVDLDPNGCIVGRECNPNNPSQCMYVYSWHSPAQDERHFTHTPCQLGYRQFCNSDVDATVNESYRAQLEELRRLGYIDVPADVALRRQVNPQN